MNYFNEVRNYDDLRREFLKLSKMYHPDLNPADKEAEVRVIFQEINNQYEKIAKTMKSNENVQSTFKEKTKEYQSQIDEKLMAVIEILTRFKCKIEVVGVYIWVSETKKEDKDIYNSLNLIWHRKREMWYYTPLKGGGKYAKNKNFDDIKSKYGSTTYNGRESKRIG